MNLESSNSLRFILVDEATIQDNINCAVVNKDAGMLSHDLKLLRARLDEEDRTKMKMAAIGGTWRQ